jgi:CubicO group peptidase (beta-lactamase class C family)
MSEINRRGMLQRSLATGLASAVSTAWAQPRGEEILPGERAAMAAAARAFMDEYDVPGLSVAVARNGHLAYAQGFGVADTRTGETVTPAHLFRIASISKPITSVSIFSLVERARLKLTDKVFGTGGILSDFAVPANVFIGDITVAHLLTHAGGGWPNGPDDPMSSHKEMNHQQLIAWTLHNVPLTSPPGTAFIYSNFGYCVLGRVIEKVTGQDYAAYVRESVLERSGITGMRLAGNTLADRADGEVVYYHRTRDPYAKNMARNDATGGWLASALDLLRFATHVDALAKTPSILMPATIRTMTTPSSVHPRYAHGWGVVEGNWWHDGVLPGTTSIIVVKQNGFCWTALANSSRQGSYRGIDRMARTMVRSVRAWSDQIQAEPFRGRGELRDEDMSGFEEAEEGR